MCIRQRIGVRIPLTAIFKEELVRKCELFSHFICLYGSEHGGRVEYVTCEFLSCLYGSERVRKGFTAPRRFLSCLYGSELKYYTFSPLLIKQNHPILLQHPFYPYLPAALIINNLPSPPKIGFSPFHPINKKSVTPDEITDFTNLPNNQINALLPPCAFVHSGIRKSAHFSLYPAQPSPDRRPPANQTAVRWRAVFSGCPG